MWIFTVIFSLMLLGSIYYLIDQNAKEQSEAEQRAWRIKQQREEKRAKERLAETKNDPKPVKTGESSGQNPTGRQVRDGGDSVSNPMPSQTLSTQHMDGGMDDDGGDS